MKISLFLVALLPLLALVSDINCNAPRIPSSPARSKPISLPKSKPISAPKPKPISLPKAVPIPKPRPVVLPKTVPIPKPRPVALPKTAPVPKTKPARVPKTAPVTAPKTTAPKKGKHGKTLKASPAVPKAPKTKPTNPKTSPKSNPKVPKAPVNTPTQPKQTNVPVGKGGNGIVNAASAWNGTPYSYGGGALDGPAKAPSGRGKNTVGFDCSSLARYAVLKATGKTLPRTADEQWHSKQCTHVPYAQRQAGDLVFWQEGAKIGHVGIVADKDNMWHAPHTGSVVHKQAIFGDIHTKSTNMVRMGQVARCA